MKYLIFKDKKKRIDFLKNEQLNFILKNILKNKNYFSSIRWSAAFKMTCIEKNASKTQYTNRCILTGRRKGLLTKFKISRIIFLKKARFGEISGLIKFFA